MLSLDDKKSKGTQSFSLFIDWNTAVYFHSFGIEYIPQEVLSKIKDNSFTYNIFRIHDNDYIMYGFSFIAFIEYMLASLKFRLKQEIIFRRNKTWVESIKRHESI